MKCSNCGAPMNGNICEYCGFEVNECDSNFPKVTFRYGNKEYKCYVSEVETIGEQFSERAENGSYLPKRVVKHIFKLIEI